MTTSTAMQLSEDLAAAVKRAADSVIGIDRDRGRGATGIVWSEDGLVVTSHAAVAGDEGTVLLPSGERRRAEMLGRDPATDVALIRIDATGLTPLPFRDPGAIEVGHLALALGRPRASVRASLRIVGALGGAVRTAAGGTLERYLETDRGIPRGFSGGPLIDIDGRGIGMNTAGLIRGADIAVPGAVITRVVKELEAHGAVTRGYLGVAVQAVKLPAQHASALGRSSGALVVAVEPASPAEAAGLVLGDVIVALDGDPIRHPDDLRSSLSEHIGSEVEATLLRAGRISPVRVTVAARRR